MAAAGAAWFCRPDGVQAQQGITAPVPPVFEPASSRQLPSFILRRHELLPLPPFCHLSPADAELASASLAGVDVSEEQSEAVIKAAITKAAPTEFEYKNW